MLLRQKSSWASLHGAFDSVLDKAVAKRDAEVYGRLNDDGAEGDDGTANDRECRVQLCSRFDAVGRFECCSKIIVTAPRE